MTIKSFEIKENKKKLRDGELNSLQRLIKIIYLLHGKSYVSQEELIKELDVTERTLYRYKRKLKDVGINISIENGQWYWDEDNYSLRLERIKLSFEEILSIVLAEKLMENYSDLSAQETFKDLVLKIMQFLKSHDKEKDKRNEFNFIEESVKTIRRKPYNIERFPHKFLIDIQKAIAFRKTLFIKYYVFHKQKYSEREIVPVELNFYRSMWHIRAFCFVKNDYREFRLDRIEDLNITENNYNPDEYTLKKYLSSKNKSTPEQKITVCFDKEIERLVHSGKFNFHVVKETERDNCTEIVFGIDRFKYDEFLGWILSYSTKAKIIKPKKAIKDIKNIISNLTKHY